jgi:hypothetical protein
VVGECGDRTGTQGCWSSESPRASLRLDRPGTAGEPQCYRKRRDPLRGGARRGTPRGRGSRRRGSRRGGSLRRRRGGSRRWRRSPGDAELGGCERHLVLAEANDDVLALLGVPHPDDVPTSARCHRRRGRADNDAGLLARTDLRAQCLDVVVAQRGRCGGSATGRHGNSVPRRRC